MLKKFSLGLMTFFLFNSMAVANDGLQEGNGMVTLTSQHDVKTTADRLEKILKAKGMTIFARVNHSAGAQKVGKKLNPTEVVIFGNPKIGTLLMQCKQSVAIDLPQKALVWKNKKGTVLLSYNDPDYLKSRHYIKGCEKALAKITGALGKFAKAATSK